MKTSTILKITSLLSLLLLTVHINHDIIIGFDRPELQSVIAMAVAAGLLYGILMLSERVSGLVITLIVSIFAAGMAPLHLRGTRILSIATAPGGFLFMWTLWALGILGFFGMALSAQGLWAKWKGRVRA